MSVKKEWSLIIFILLVLSIGIISASELKINKDSLSFNLGVKEEGCNFFSISSNNYSGDFYSIMKWAEKNTQVLNQEDFKFLNSETNLTILYYPPTIQNFSDKEYIDVCIKGNITGYWEGILEYKTESEIGNGTKVLLKVNISNNPEEFENQEILLNETEQNPGITGKVIEFAKTNNGKITTGIILTLMILLTGMFSWTKLVYNKKVKPKS